MQSVAAAHRIAQSCWPAVAGGLQSAAVLLPLANPWQAATSSCLIKCMHVLIKCMHVYACKCMHVLCLLAYHQCVINEWSAAQPIVPCWAIKQQDMAAMSLR